MYLLKGKHKLLNCYSHPFPCLLLTDLRLRLFWQHNPLPSETPEINAILTNLIDFLEVQKKYFAFFSHW